MFNSFSYQGPAPKGLPQSEGQLAEARDGTARVKFTEKGYLYANTEYSYELGIFDLGSGLSPQLVSTVRTHRGKAVAVDSENDLLFTFRNGGADILGIHDVSDPAAPVLIYEGTPGRLDNKLNRMKAGGGLLIIEPEDQDANGLVLMDVSDPTAPVEADFDFRNRTTLFHADYPFFYGMRGTGLRVYDVSAGTLNNIAVTYLPGQCEFISKSGDFLALSNAQDFQVEIVDASDPFNPVHTASFSDPRMTGFVRSVIVGQAVYVARENLLLEVSIKDPAAPKVENEWSLNGSEQIVGGIAHAGGYLYWQERDKGLIAFKLPAVQMDFVEAQQVAAGTFKGGRADFKRNASVAGALSAGRLLVGGGESIGRRAVSADATVGQSDFYVAVTDTSAARTLTLAEPLGATREHIIKDESGGASTNAITIATGGGATIDGAATASISTDYGSVHLISDGENWYTV